MRRLAPLLLLVGMALGQQTQQAQQNQPAQPAPAPACPAPQNASLSLEKADGFPEFLKEPKLRADTVDQLLATIWVRFVDPTFGGRDWEKITAEYKKKALEAKSEREFYGALRELTSQLDDQSGFASSTLLEAEAIAAQRPFTGIGTLVYGSADRTTLTVRWVVPGGPADQAGLKPRDKIVAVDGQPCPNTDKIRGAAGSNVTLTVRAPGQAPRQVTIQRGRVNFPGAVLISQRLAADPGVGYLWVGDNSSDAIVAEIDKALTALSTGATPLRGLVLDLRGSTGLGMGIMETLLGHFVADVRYSFKGPETEIRRTIRLRPPDLTKLPLAVLVDKGTSTSANMTAGILQQRPNTTIIGQQTAGGARIVQDHDLPDGSILLISEAQFLRADGKPLDGDKVTPTVLVNQDWTDFAEADDPFLKAAIERLK